MTITSLPATISTATKSHALLPGAMPLAGVGDQREAPMSKSDGARAFEIFRGTCYGAGQPTGIIAQYTYEDLAQAIYSEAAQRTTKPVAKVRPFSALSGNAAAFIEPLVSRAPTLR